MALRTTLRLQVIPCSSRSKIQATTSPTSKASSSASQFLEAAKLRSPRDEVSSANSRMAHRIAFIRPFAGKPIKVCLHVPKPALLYRDTSTYAIATINVFSEQFLLTFPSQINCLAAWASAPDQCRY